MQRSNYYAWFRRFFKVLINQINDAIYILDPDDWSILEVNDIACNSLGYTYDELRALTIYDIDPDANKILTSSATNVSMREDGTAKIETSHIRKDGTIFPVYIRAKIVKSEGKNYVCSIASDLTERKKFEEELMEKNHRLEEFQRIAVGRELKMIELKKEINDLNEQLGKEKPYHIEE